MRAPATCPSSTTASTCAQLGGDPGLRLPGGARPLPARVPAGTAALVMDAPYRGFALALQLFYPDAMLPEGGHGRGRRAADPPDRAARGGRDGRARRRGRPRGADRARHDGRRRRRGRLPRDHRPRLLHRPRRLASRTPWSATGSSCTPACRIGQDGFGFAMGPKGHLKVPQIGRVIIQDDVEIGANSCVDRGALKDTVIGEGTKIDNLVQIGHNVVIGRHCVIVGQVGISGSTELGDFVVMGGQSGAGRAHQDRGGRADRGRLACQGRRSGRRPHGRHAGRPVRGVGTAAGAI